MKLSRVAIYVAVAILVVGAVGAGVATGKKKKFKTTVSIELVTGTYGDQFEGDVGSKKKKCRKNRNVTVKEQGGGNVGTDKSDNFGHYVVDAGGFAQPGDYFAKVKKKKFGKKGKKKTCKKARSATITVP